ncbi:hypothetical protein TKK_0002938 [Trichogramma kaykai]
MNKGDLRPSTSTASHMINSGQSVTDNDKVFNMKLGKSFSELDMMDPKSFVIVLKFFTLTWLRRKLILGAVIAVTLGRNYRKKDKDKNTPLHWAACFGHKSIIQFLTENGSNVNAVNDCGATLLHEAVNRRDFEMCLVLLRSSTDPLVRAIKGTFAAKTSYDISKSNASLQTQIEKYFGEASPKEIENVLRYSEEVKSFDFLSKPNLIDIHQDSSVNSLKSLDNTFNIPTPSHKD